MSDLIAIAAYKIQNPIEAPFRALLTMIRRHQTVKALNKLSNGELADIGIDRKNIRNLAARVVR